MEPLLRIFENQPFLCSLVQIVLDILILGLLAVVLLGKRRKISKKDGAIMDSFQKIIEETGTISRKFEANLQQRQDLIQQVTSRLDQRILEAQRMCDRLEQSMRQPPVPSHGDSRRRPREELPDRETRTGKKSFSWRKRAWAQRR